MGGEGGLRGRADHIIDVAVGAACQVGVAM